MQTMRESWTDERLDDLNSKVDRGFDRVDARFDRVDARFERVDDRFERVDADIQSLRGEMNARFDTIQRTMVLGVIALTTGMLAGFGGLAALIATQV
jgi:hypothetical protein